MALPQFLIIEMRMAFRACAQHHRSSYVRPFHSTTSRSEQSKSRPSPPPPPPSPARWPYNGAIPQRQPSSSTSSASRDAQSPSSQTDLTPYQPERTAIDTGRRVPVPLKVIPNPDLGPNVRLTPRERLHVEVLTRRQPVKTEKKIYRERLQIYHMGAMKENVMAILKVSGIVVACTVTFVIAPAHLHAGHDLWLVGLIFLAGFVPGFAVNYMTMPMVSRVFLNLPAKARETPKAAMEYAKNLPQNAELDIRYMKPWGLEDSIKARISEFEPTKGNLLRPLTFKWMDRFARQKGWFIKNPTSFFVAEKTAIGEASKNTVPGIWGSVYQRLVNASGGTVTKWSKTEPQMQLR